jgi:hypothetical protein
MRDNETRLDIETLFEEGRALADALLSHDLTEVRFRARQMTSVAALLGVPKVEAVAQAFMDVLGQEGATPDIGYGSVLFALSDALNEALGRTPGITGEIIPNVGPDTGRKP